MYQNVNSVSKDKLKVNEVAFSGISRSADGAGWELSHVHIYSLQDILGTSHPC